MNNPVTSALLKHVDDPHLAQFIIDWDAFESLALLLYRQRGPDRQAESELLLLQDRLRRSYARWKSLLKPFWPESKLDGRPLSTDPFEKLLAISEPGQFAEDWQLIRLLPVAREVLNIFLFSHQNAAD